MAEEIKLEIVTPEGSVVNEAAQIVMAPGANGEFGVLSGHTPFLTSLKTGMLKYRDSSGAERVVSVSGGFAEALADRITVLAESAERRRSIDEARARDALARAEQRLEKDQDSDVDFIRAKAALLRAINRLSVIQTK